MGSDAGSTPWDVTRPGAQVSLRGRLGFLQGCAQEQQPCLGRMVILVLAFSGSPMLVQGASFLIAVTSRVNAT